MTNVERDWRGETIKKSFFFFSLSSYLLTVNAPAVFRRGMRDVRVGRDSMFECFSLRA